MVSSKDAKEVGNREHHTHSRICVAFHLWFAAKRNSLIRLFRKETPWFRCLYFGWFWVEQNNDLIMLSKWIIMVLLSAFQSRNLEGSGQTGQRIWAGWVTVMTQSRAAALVSTAISGPRCVEAAFKQVKGAGQRSWAPERAQRPSRLWTVWRRLHLFIAHVCQEGCSTWLQPVVMCYCLLLPIGDLPQNQLIRYSRWGCFAFILVQVL